MLASVVAKPDGYGKIDKRISWIGVKHLKKLRIVYKENEWNHDEWNRNHLDSGRCTRKL